MAGNRTGTNFYNPARNNSGAVGMNNLNNPSSNSLFGGDSTSQPARAGGPKANNFTKVVADDADDDWDVDDEPTNVN